MPMAMAARTSMHSLFVVLLLLFAGSGVAAAQEVGQVVAAEGTAEIVRGAVASPAQAGAAIAKGDELRTGRPGRIRVMFQDQSVVTVSDDSRLTVDEQVFDPDRSKAQSNLGLLKGKVSSIVSAYYNWSGSKYEVKTPTAVAGVRGTEFAVVYDDSVETTQVLGFSGEVRVHSLADLEGPGVIVTARQVSTIGRGRQPSKPQQIEDRRFRQELEGLDFFGAGVGYHLALPDTLRAGNVPAPDRAPVAGVNAPPRPGHPDVSTLVGKSPLVFGKNTGQVGVIIHFPK